MNKKRILLTGTIIILSVLFLNIVFSDRSAKTSLTLANIEAMAEQESPDGRKKRTCASKPVIYASRYRQNGVDGKHHGLMRIIRYEKAILPFYRLIYFRLPGRTGFYKSYPFVTCPGGIVVQFLNR